MSADCKSQDYFVLIMKNMSNLLETINVIILILTKKSIDNLNLWDSFIMYLLLQPAGVGSHSGYQDSDLQRPLHTHLAPTITETSQTHGINTNLIN